MKKYFLIMMAAGLFACGGNNNQENTSEEAAEQPTEGFSEFDAYSPDNLYNWIDSTENALGKDSTGQYANANFKLLEAYDAFVRKNPNNEYVPEMLFKAGEVCMGINQGAASVKYLSRVIDGYPNYDKRPYAIFLKAFVLENQLKDFDQAEEYYQMFLAEYPNHEMAKDAKFTLKFLGKSDEELLKELQKQNEANQAKEAA